MRVRASDASSKGTAAAVLSTSARARSVSSAVHAQLLLQAAQFEVVARHFCGHCHLHAAALRLHGFGGGARRALLVGHAAEQIDLPRGRQTGRELVARAGLAAVVGRARAVGAGVDVERRPAEAARAAFDGLRFGHPRRGHAQIAIGGHGLRDQRVELGVVEGAPELGHRLRLAVGRLRKGFRHDRLAGQR
jgi:hypothetical protein